MAETGPSMPSPARLIRDRDHVTCSGIMTWLETTEGQLPLVRGERRCGSLQASRTGWPAYEGMSQPAMPQPPTLAPTGLIDLDETFLPVGRMRQIARVIDLEGDTIRGQMRLGRDHWVWPEHFPGDPVFPGTLLIEAAGQLLALWAWAQGSRGRPRLVRTGAEFHHPVGRQVTHLDLQAQVRRKRHLYFGSIQVSSGDLEVATVDAVLAVLPPLSAA